jgi:hypothetical protein
MLFKRYKVKKFFLQILIFLFLFTILAHFQERILIENFTRISTFKQVLYYSKHKGTLSEMIPVFASRKINYTLHMNELYSLLSKYGDYISPEVAEQLLLTDFYKNACKTYDLIIVSDVLSLGRPFYQASPNRCKAKILIQLTTRFDFGHVNDPVYINLFKQMVDNPNIYWQPNNDYDMGYLNSNGIFPKPERSWLIRPIGHSIKRDELIKVESPKVMIFNKYFYFIENELKNLTNSTMYEFINGRSYGGARRMAKHKFFVYFPYEFSTMKVFENAYADVLTAIPTPRFLSEIINKAYRNYHFRVHGEIIRMINTFSNWTEYIDVYNKRYNKMYMQFDSLSELAKLIDEEAKIDRERYRTIRKQIMDLHVKEENEKWDHFFKTIFSN